MSKNKNSFVNMALIYSATLIIVKFIGAISKIIIGNAVPEVVTSYISFVYPYFNALLAVTTVGIPAAIAKIVSEYNARGEEEKIERLFIVMRRVMIVVGVIATLVLFFTAPLITWLGDMPEATYAMQAFSLALLFVAFSSVYRGYFQGYAEMLPFGLSQIADQLGKVIFSIGLSITLLGVSYELSAAGSTFGATLGTIFGALTLMFIKNKRDAKRTLGDLGIIKIADHKDEILRIVKIAIPVVIGASVLPLVDMIDTQIIKRRLVEIGYSDDLAKTFYSYYSYYSASMINFPQVVFTAIQASLLPVVSYAIAAGNHQSVSKTIKTALKVALLVGVPAALGLFSLARPIMMLLYPTKPGVIEHVPAILGIASFSLIPLSVFQVTTGILQGMEKQILPAKNLLIGAVVKIPLCYILVGMPAINVKGAAISTFVAFLIATALNIAALLKHSEGNFDLVSIFVKPMISAGVMAACVIGGYGFLFGILGNALSAVASIIIGAVVYIVMVIVLRTLDKDDLEFLPGKRLLSKVVK